MRRDVTFLSQGLTCKGWLYVPDNLSERRPAIVMAHGFSAVKEMYLANFAEKFVGAGLVVLVFDYRYFGDSEGEPSVLPTPESYEWFTHTGEKIAPNWRNKVTLESLEKFLEYNPAANIHRISPTPLLMLVASNDTLTLTDLAVAAYEQAREPKSLVIVQGRHFDAYTEPGLSQSAPPAVEWFKRYLLA